MDVHQALKATIRHQNDFGKIKARIFHAKNDFPKCGHIRDGSFLGIGKDNVTGVLITHKSEIEHRQFRIAFGVTIGDIGDRGGIRRDRGVVESVVHAVLARHLFNLALVVQMEIAGKVFVGYAAVHFADALAFERWTQRSIHTGPPVFHGGYRVSASQFVDCEIEQAAGIFFENLLQMLESSDFGISYPGARCFPAGLVLQWRLIWS